MMCVEQDHILTTRRNPIFSLKLTTRSSESQLKSAQENTESKRLFATLIVEKALVRKSVQFHKNNPMLEKNCTSAQNIRKA